MNANRREDRILFVQPEDKVISDVTESLKSGGCITPGFHAKTERKGQLYSCGIGYPISGEELSWFLHRGYVKSELKGRQALSSDGNDIEWVKPTISYTITKKGTDTKVWY